MDSKELIKKTRFCIFLTCLILMLIVILLQVKSYSLASQIVLSGLILLLNTIIFAFDSILKNTINMLIDASCYALCFFSFVTCLYRF